jgi:hypothetical protein
MVGDGLRSVAVSSAQRAGRLHRPRLVEADLAK